MFASMSRNPLAEHRRKFPRSAAREIARVQHSTHCAPPTARAATTIQQSSRALRALAFSNSQDADNESKARAALPREAGAFLAELTCPDQPPARPRTKFVR